MNPSQIRQYAASILRRAVLAMMSAEWDIALEGKSSTQVAEAGKLLLAMQRVRLRLGNARLADIREKLIENEDALNESAQRLNGALDNLQDAQVVLQSAGGFLKIISRVVKIVA